MAEAFEAICVLDAPLNERLTAYREQVRRLDAPLAAAYDELIGRLLVSEAGSHAPKVGDEMPSFVLPAGTGRLVRLEELLGSGPVIVTLNRGHWCSYCRMHLRSLARAHEELSALGARLVSILPDRQQFVGRLRRETGQSIEILSDLDNAYSLSLGLVMWIGDRLEELMRAKGHNLEIVHGAKGWLMPLPATFILDRQGRIAGQSVEPDFRRRMSVEEIKAVLSRIVEAGR